MDDLPARLRQGVIRQDAIYLDDGIDVQATEDLMTDAAAELDRLREFRSEAIALLQRAYDSGHRHGWEPGESTSEVMNALHAFLENETDG